MSQRRTTSPSPADDAGQPGGAAEGERRATDEPRVPVLGLRANEFEAQCTALLAAAGEASYRAAQLRDWIYHRTPEDFSSMSDLPRRLRERLEATWVLHPLLPRIEQKSRDGTRKFLWGRRGEGAIESVLIPDRDRITYCVSTQIGCPVKCSFCATGFGGFRGQLDASEIVDQVLSMRRITGLPPSNIVYMGMGEPLLNFENVVRSIDVLTLADQVGLGSRRITVSTVGVPARIRELGRLFPQVKLALSLHAARDELRDRIIPLNRKYPLGDVLEALREHTNATGKKATFEYVILPGVNDTERDAREVVGCLRGIPSRINLLAFNPFPGAPYEKPGIRRVLRFREWLERSYGGTVTVRRSRGEDIQGACGQLSFREARMERTEASSVPPPAGWTLEGPDEGRRALASGPDIK